MTLIYVNCTDESRSVVIVHHDITGLTKAKPQKQCVKAKYTPTIQSTAATPSAAVPLTLLCRNFGPLFFATLLRFIEVCGYLLMHSSLKVPSHHCPLG